MNEMASLSCDIYFESSNVLKYSPYLWPGLPAALASPSGSYRAGLANFDLVWTSTSNNKLTLQAITYKSGVECFSRLTEDHHVEGFVNYVFYMLLSLRRI